MSAVATAAFRQFVQETVSAQTKITSPDLRQATANAIEAALHLPLPNEPASVAIVREQLGFQTNQAATLVEQRTRELAVFKAQMRQLQLRRDLVGNELIALRLSLATQPKRARQERQPEIDAKQREVAEADQRLKEAQKTFDQMFATQEKAQIAFEAAKSRIALEETRAKLAQQTLTRQRELQNRARPPSTSFQVLLAEEQKALGDRPPVCVPIVTAELKRQQDELNKQLVKLAEDLARKFAQEQNQEINKLKRDLQSQTTGNQVLSEKSKRLEKQLRESEARRFGCELGLGPGLGHGTVSPGVVSDKTQSGPCQACPPCVGAGAGPSAPSTVPSAVPLAPGAPPAAPPPAAPVPIAPPPPVIPPGVPPAAPPAPPVPGAPPVAPAAAAAVGQPVLSHEEQLKQPKQLRKTGKSVEAPAASPSAGAEAPTGMMAEIRARQLARTQGTQGTQVQTEQKPTGPSVSACVSVQIPPALQSNKQCVAELDPLMKDGPCVLPKALPYCARCLRQEIIVKGVFVPGKRPLSDNFLKRLNDDKVPLAVQPAVKAVALKWINVAPKWRQEEDVYIESIEGKPLSKPFGKRDNHELAMKIEAEARQGFTVQAVDRGGSRNKILGLLSKQQWKEFLDPANPMCVVDVDARQVFESYKKVSTEFEEIGQAAPGLRGTKREVGPCAKKPAQCSACQKLDVFYKWVPNAGGPVLAPLSKEDLDKIDKKLTKASEDNIGALLQAARKLGGAPLVIQELNTKRGEIGTEFISTNKPKLIAWLQARTGRTIAAYFPVSVREKAEAEEEEWIQGTKKVTDKATIPTSLWQKTEVREGSCVIILDDVDYLQLRESQPSAPRFFLPPRVAALPSNVKKATEPSLATKAQPRPQQQPRPQRQPEPEPEPQQVIAAKAPKPKPTLECTDENGVIHLADQNNQPVLEQTPDTKLTQAVMACLKSRGEVSDCRVTNSLCVTCDQLPIFTQDLHLFVPAKDNVRERFNQRTWNTLAPKPDNSSVCLIAASDQLEPTQVKLIEDAATRRECAGTDILFQMTGPIDLSVQEDWARQGIPFKTGFHVPFERVQATANWPDSLFLPWTSICDSEPVALSPVEFKQAYDRHQVWLSSQ